MTNKKYSFKDFTGQSFVDIDPSEFNGKGDIVGSCFAQEANSKAILKKDIVKTIFPIGTLGINFLRCNLDNVKLPTGSEIDSRCSKRKIKIQNDGEDWVIDNDLKSIEPVDKKRFITEERSIDPKDIPIKITTK